MKIGPFTFLIGVFALVLAACDANTRPTSSPPANAKVLDGLVRAYEPECIKQVHKKPSSEQETLITALRANDMTVASFCKCAGKTFFGSYSQADLAQYASDIIKYKREISEHEPHRTRVAMAGINCLAGVWPGAT